MSGFKEFLQSKSRWTLVAGRAAVLVSLPGELGFADRVVITSAETSC